MQGAHEAIRHTRSKDGCGVLAARAGWIVIPGQETNILVEVKHRKQRDKLAECT